LNLIRRIAGAARLLATGKLALSAGFDGAQMQRRLVAWRASGESINSLLRHGGEVQRARARQLVRSNPYAANASASFTAHAVGCGIKPSSLVEDAALKDRIQRLWLAWTDEADADGLTDLYGLQAMAARAMFEAGECFIRFRARRPEDGLTVPLQLQMLSSEHLPLGKCETLPNGHEVIFGIELDRIGRRVAYHFHRTHPGDVRQSGHGELVRVPADQVCHVFHPIAEGQLRGVPWVAPAMVRLWLLDQYDDAELDRKKVAAMFAGFITRPGPDDVMGEDGSQKDADGAALVGLQPGTMQLLLPGEDIKFSDPADVGGTYESFQYRTLLACCAAMGVPYTNVTGDLRQANYSSLREGKLEFRRRIEQFQHATLVFQLCRPVWQGDVWFFDKPARNHLHPTMKPVALVQRAIRNSSKSRDIVLDPFGGSGSTLIACEKTGRHARLVELDPKYCDVIIQRWQEFSGGTALLDEDGRSVGARDGSGEGKHPGDLEAGGYAASV
jgi:lambda family phage portal protein